MPNLEHMPDMMMGLDRRLFLKTIPAVALSAQEAVRVPWSAGVEAPTTKAPADATDCHHHIYDSRFPMAPNATLRPGAATIADYRLLQKRIGTTRHVIVQPSTYGVDNRCLIDALQQFGTSTVRGIAVVNPDVNQGALKDLHSAGVRGLRFNQLQTGATTLDMLEPLAKRIAPLGWHIQLNASPQQILAASTLLARLPCPVVFDHFGHTLAQGPADPAFAVIVQLLQSKKGWLKLSADYVDNKVGEAAYPQSAATAKAYVAAAPDRLVWGSDWPHPTAKDKPDDALLFDLLAKWVPDPAVHHRILVENPARLYGFN